MCSVPVMTHGQNQIQQTTKVPSAEMFSFGPFEALKPEEIGQIPKCSLRITH